MVARELLGMGLMSLGGLSNALVVMAHDVMDRFGLPYFPVMGTACLTWGLFVLAMIGPSGALSKLTQRQRKWAVIRGLFGALTLTLQVLSNVAGAPLGDASTLFSINVVVAALLGRIFLGEPLKALHICALLSSTVGAVLVSKPQALFGASEEAEAPHGQPVLGYALALLAGVASGGIFIAARKAQGINPSVLMFSVSINDGASFWVLYLSGVLEPVSLSPFLVEPGLAALAFLALFVLFMLLCSTVSAGGQLCPAVVSATLYTSVGMTASFVGQTVLKQEYPNRASLVGAGFMLLGVALMALARRAPSAPSSSCGGGAAADIESSSEATASTSTMSSASAKVSETSAANRNEAGEESEVEEEDDAASLATFIASEFSGLAPTPSSRPGARQRRSAPVVAEGVPGAASRAVNRGAQVFGAASA